MFLSGGEVRRLMMARIMINKPKVILLDEPMAALDPIVVQDIQKYILKNTILRLFNFDYRSPSKKSIRYC